MERSLSLYTGAKIPLLGLGTYLPESKPEDIGPAVTTALSCGYRHFDCAAVYNNEHVIGPVLAKAPVPRSELFLTSKLWNDRRRPADVRDALETTLVDLCTIYLDLYLIHFPVVWKKGTIMKPDRQTSLREAWETLEALVDEGKIRHIGVANFCEQEIHELLSFARIRPAVNQIELHPKLPQKDLVKFCQMQGVAVTAFSPLDRGGKGGLLDHATVTRIAAVHNVPPSAILLRWNLSRGVVVIPKSKCKDRIKANADIWGFDLTQEDTAEIDKLQDGSRGVNQPWSTYPDSNSISGYMRWGVARCLTGIIFTFVSLDLTSIAKRFDGGHKPDIT